MLKPKKKITKKELKQDKFVLYTLKAKEFAEAHSKLLFQGGIALLILIVLIVLYARSKQSAGIKANELLGEAELAQNIGNLQRAEEVLKQLVEDYDGTYAAGEGTFMLAKLYWQRNDTTDAETYFKKYFEDYGDDDLLTAGALAGYADCLVWQKKPAEAARYYEKAGRVNEENPLTPSYLYSAAKAYFDAQNYQKVKSLASEIAEKYEKSEFKSMAEILMHMAELKS